MKKLLLFGLLGLRLAAQPVITVSPTNQIVLNGSNVLFAVAVSGTGPFTYQWQFNGANLPNNIITTVAGTNFSGFVGDGGAATNARLSAPKGITTDSAGNLCIADSSNNRIRLVNTNGMINTVAGTNVSNFSGDGGPANAAGLQNPYAVSADAWGNYFIADAANNRIRKVDMNGIITTIAGTNGSGYFGDGGVATNAGLANPEGVAVDGGGNLFISDYNNFRIRRVDTNGIITTFAGTNAYGFAGDGGLAVAAKLAAPQGIASDNNGNLFIADSGNNRIRRVDTNGFIITIAGTNNSGFLGDGGPAVAARLTAPGGVVVDAFGYVFVADTSNHRVRQVDPNGIITTVAGNGSTSFSGDGGPATNASLYQPFGLAMDASGGLLIADQSHYRIRKITLARSPILQLNNATTNNAGNYQVIITSPSGSLTSSVVTLSVVFPPTFAVQPQSVVATNGNSATFSATASGTSPFGYQWYFTTNALDGATNAVLDLSVVAPSQAGNYTCVITNAYGSVTSYIATLVVLTPPSIVAQPTNQTVVIGGSVTLSVGVSGSGPFTYQWRVNGTNLPNRNGLITRVAGKAGQSGFGGDGGVATSAVLSNPSGVAIDSVGNLFIADSGNIRIRMVDTNYVSTTNGLIGIIRTFAGIGAGGYSGDGGMATNAGLASAGSVMVDGFGNVYLPDSTRIRKVDANGLINTIAGTNITGFSGDGGQAVNAKLNSVRGAAADPWGNLYFADWGNNRVRRINTNGLITTVAGTNSSGFSGDGGLAINAQLNHPTGVATDGTGNLFIMDTSRVRRVDANGVITTIAGNGTAVFSGDGGAATNAALNQPNGMAVDAYSDIFISDSYNNRIRMVDVTGNISTVAGTGGTSYAGDGGVATNASLYQPRNVAVDSYGNFYITDSTGPIRKVDLGRVPMLQLNNVAATNAGNYDVIITSPYGSVTSSIVSFTVLSPPSIIVQPRSVLVPVGSSTNFSVAVSNYPPFSYQWFTSSGRGATAFPFVSNGHVQQAIMVDAGQGYVSTPQVHIVGGSGSGATATASLVSGSVFFVFIQNPGSGYTIPPTIQIDPPSPITNLLLPGETNATLAISPATIANATNYFVVITNSYGSVTSTTVALFVFLSPQNFAAQSLGAGLQLEFTGTPNYRYMVQSTTNLIPPIEWQSILTNPADVNGNWSFTVTNLTDVPGRFYRAVGQ